MPQNAARFSLRPCQSWLFNRAIKMAAIHPQKDPLKIIDFPDCGRDYFAAALAPRNIRRSENFGTKCIGTIETLVSARRLAREQSSDEQEGERANHFRRSRAKQIRDS